MNIELKFVNRFEEIETLKKLSEKDLPTPLYIYGPEGCGKTRLLKEFLKNFNGIGIYIDALEREDINNALILSLGISSDVKNLILSIAKDVFGNVGTFLAQKIFNILEKISIKYKLKNEVIVLIIDDITRALGIDEIDRYIKWLYEAIEKIKTIYKPKSILIIATTSEGISLSRVLRHSYTKVNLVWNLNRESYLELINQLNPPDKEIVNTLWKLTGGNPRRVIEIVKWYNWNINNWLRDLKDQLRRVFK